MKLLVCDIEGTIFRPHQIKSAQHASYIWTAIADQLGKAAIEEEIDTQWKWRKGEYGPNNLGQAYMRWVKESIEIHRKYGLKKDEFERIIDQAPYVEGVQQFFEFLNRDEYIPVFISGGIQNLSEKACRDLGVEEDNSYAACKYYFNSNKLIDKSITFLDTSNFYGKQEIVKIALRKYGLGERDWIFIGDGINDVSVAKAAPISIGIDPIDPLKAEVDFYFENFYHFMESDALIKELRLLNQEPYKNNVSDAYLIKMSGGISGQSQEFLKIASDRVKRQVGKLDLPVLEKRAWVRMGEVAGLHSMNDFKLKSKGIEDLLQSGELSFLFHSQVLKGKEIVSAILQPFSNAAEIMIFVSIALTEPKSVLLKLVDRNYSLNNLLDELHNDDLRAVLREYIRYRNIAAHSYQRIPVEAAKSFIQRTYEGIQRLELMIND